MKTDHFLKDKIALPDDISKLVQQVYDTATDSEVSGLKEARAKFDKDQKNPRIKQKYFKLLSLNSINVEGQFINGLIGISQMIGKARLKHRQQFVIFKRL